MTPSTKQYTTHSPMLIRGTESTIKTLLRSLCCLCLCLCMLMLCLHDTLGTNILIFPTFPSHSSAQCAMSPCFRQCGAACLHWTHKSVSWQIPLCIFFVAKSQKPKLPFLYNLVNYTDGKLRWILAPPFCHILQIYLQLESYKRFISSIQNTFKISTKML